MLGHVAPYPAEFFALERDSHNDYWIYVLSRVLHHGETAASDIAINYIINFPSFYLLGFFLIP